MSKPETWLEMQDWLIKQFGEQPITRWHGPEAFSSKLDGVEISNGDVRGDVIASGITGEDCIRKLFSKIVNHGPEAHVVFGCDDKRVTIDPQTLDVKPFKY
jgi:hypothetical protein